MLFDSEKMTENIKLIVISLFLSLVSLAAKGQGVYVRVFPENINQLRLKLEKCKVDTEKIRVMLNLANIYYELGQDKKNADSALFFAKESQILAEKTHNEYFSCQSFCMLGEILLVMGRTSQGASYFFRAIKSEQIAGNILEEGNMWQRFAAASEFKNSVIYYKKAIALFQRAKDSKKEIDARLKLALAYRLNENITTAVEITEGVIADYEHTHPKQLAYAHFILSALNRAEGNLNISLFHILKSIELDDPTKDSLSASRFYGELGQIYQAMGNTEKSIYWYRKTVAIRKKMPGLKTEYITRTIGFIVVQLLQENKPEEALREVRSAESSFPPKADLDRAVYGQMEGDCYTALKRFDLAERSYLKMVPYLNKNPLENEIPQTMQYTFAKFYIDRHNYIKSAPYVSRLLSYAYSITLRMNVELLKFKQDSATGHYLLAINHFKKYKALSDTIFNTVKSKQIEELQIKYRTKEREKDIAGLRKTEFLQRERITSSEKVKNLTFGSIVLLVILVALLYNRYLLKQKSNAEMYDKNSMLNRIIEEKDNLLEEKQWLLKEIHHRVKNNLQIVMGLLQRQSSYINNEEALTAIQNSENRMHSIALIHQKLYQSQDMNLISMREYVSELTNYLVETAGVGNRLQFEKKLDDIYLNVSQAVPLGLILNEALTNAIKYAYPENDVGTISVSLTTSEDCIILNIADHGRGLPPGFTFENSTTLGLNLIKGLSKQLSGKLDFCNHNGLTIMLAFVPTKFNFQQS